jgi:hypothetical protein
MLLCLGNIHPALQRILGDQTEYRLLVGMLLRGQLSALRLNPSFEPRPNSNVSQHRSPEGRQSRQIAGYYQSVRVEHRRVRSSSQ